MNSLIELSVSSEVSLILSVLKQNYQNLSTFKIINQTCPCQINLTDALISFINRHNIRKLRISSENLQKAQFFHFLANNDHIKDLKLEFYSNNYSETNTIDQTPDSDFYCKEFRSLSLEIEPTTANYCIKLLNSCTKLEKLKLKIPKFCPLSKISNILFQKILHLSLCLDTITNLVLLEKFCDHEDPFLRTLKFCFTKNDFFCYKNPLKLENISSLVYTKPSLENLYMNPDIKCKTIEYPSFSSILDEFLEKKRDFVYNFINVGCFRLEKNLVLNSLYDHFYSNYLGLCKFILLNKQKNYLASKIIIKETKYSQNSINLTEIIKEIKKNPRKILKLSKLFIQSFLKIQKINEPIHLKLHRLESTKNIITYAENGSKTKIIIYKPKPSLFLNSFCYISLSQVESLEYYTKLTNFNHLTSLLSENFLQVSGLCIKMTKKSGFIPALNLKKLCESISPKIKNLCFFNFLLGEKSLKVLKKFLIMNKDLETIQFNIKCQCSYYKNILNFFDSYYSSENFVVHELKLSKIFVPTLDFYNRLEISIKILKKNVQSQKNFTNLDI